MNPGWIVQPWVENTKDEDMKAHEFLTESDYTIQRNDTLSKIALDNDTTVDEIMALNRGNKAIRNRDTIYAGGTIKLPDKSNAFDPSARVKRQGSTGVSKPDDIAKIGNQEFPLTKGPKSNDDKGDFNPGIDDPEWEFPTVELGFGDPGYTPIIGNKVEKRSNGNWYYPGNPFPVRPDVARFAEKRLKDLDIVKSKDIGSQKFPMTKVPKAPGPDQSDAETNRLNKPKKSANFKPPARPDQSGDQSPIPNARVSSRFGKRKAPALPGGIGFGSEDHQGVDFKVPDGTSVYAPNNAVVLRSSWGPRAGKFIELGDSQGNITHKFFHLSKSLVEKGETVRKGQEIAKSGNSGASSGAHLHWEKWIDGKPVNPEKFVRLSDD